MQPNWSSLKVDVIVTTGPATLAAKKASATIPIVFAAANDPVGTGLVSSLARPGGNITGLSVMAPDLDGKRLELLKEAFPKVARVAFLWQPTGSRGNLALTDMEAAAKALGVKLLSLEVRVLDDFDSAFARAKRERRPGAHYDPRCTYHCSATSRVGLCGKESVAGDVSSSEFVEAGGLMSYAPRLCGLMAARR